MTYASYFEQWEKQGVKHPEQSYDLSETSFPSYYQKASLEGLAEDLTRQLELVSPVAVLLADNDEYLELLEDYLSTSFKVPQQEGSKEEVLVCMLHPELLQEPQLLFCELITLMVSQKLVELGFEPKDQEEGQLVFELFCIYVGYGQIMRNSAMQAQYFQALRESDLDELLGELPNKNILYAFAEAEKLFEKAKYQEAEDLMLKLVEELEEGEPMQADAYNNAGYYAMAGKAFQRAKMYFEQARGIDPEFVAAQENLEFLNLLKGKVLVAPVPDGEEPSVEKIRNLGFAAALEGNLEEAAELLEQALAAEESAYLLYVVHKRMGNQVEVDRELTSIWADQYQRVFFQ